MHGQQNKKMIIIVIIIVVLVVLSNELAIFKIHTIFVWCHCMSVGDEKEYAMAETQKKWLNRSEMR